MSKLPGIGEIHEGTLEKDPLHDTFQIRSLQSNGDPIVLRIEDILSEYVGSTVRLTVAYADRLEAAAAHARSQNLEAVGDLPRSGS